jgi:hypothetical protein
MQDATEARAFVVLIFLVLVILIISPIVALVMTVYDVASTESSSGSRLPQIGFIMSRGNCWDGLNKTCRMVFGIEDLPSAVCAF